MNKIYMPPIILAFSLLGSCGPTGTKAIEIDDAPPSQSDLIERGAMMAEALCAQCHAIGATGASNHPTAPPFRELAWKYPIETLAEPLAEGIVVGHPEMPEWRFIPSELDALLAYLDSIQVDREI